VIEKEKLAVAIRFSNQQTIAEITPLLKQQELSSSQEVPPQQLHWEQGI
jgi:hypothetical protein